MKNYPKITEILKIIIIIILIVIFSTSQTDAQSLRKEKVENNKTKEVKRLAPLIESFNTENLSALAISAPTESLGPNLIPNPSLETMNSAGGPASWNKGGYGSNTRQFVYLAPGNTGTKAIKVNVTNYISGDVKWYFNDIPVRGGDIYEFSDYSASNVPSIVTIRYKTNTGSFIYKDVLQVPPSNTYRKNITRITIPQNVTSLTIFHLIKSNGSLSIDDYSLQLVTSASSSVNLVPNGDFEIIGLNNMPVNWNKGGWGSNTRVFTYPVVGQTNSTGASVKITSYVSGDAKWYFTPIDISHGIYTYSDQIISNSTTTITAQFINIDGSIVYKDLLQVPPATELTASYVDFSVGTEVSKVTIFHLIKSQSQMTIDNVSIIKKSDPVGIFLTGAVTMRFDDGWLSQYENAIPKMESLGIKGTFYITTGQKAEDGFPGFMNISQIRGIYSRGHEIGAHTKTHPFLSQLTIPEQQDEISGSRNDLLLLNVGPILSFAYPFGDYDSTTISIVKSAGFSSGLSTIDGFTNQTSDKHQIERINVGINTKIEDIKHLIDQAKIQKKWLILAFHEINNSGNEYSITPLMFNQIADYIISKGIPVVTTSQGMESLQ